MNGGGNIGEKRTPHDGVHVCFFAMLKRGGDGEIVFGRVVCGVGDGEGVECGGSCDRMTRSFSENRVTQLVLLLLLLLLLLLPTLLL